MATSFPCVVSSKVAHSALIQALKSGDHSLLSFDNDIEFARTHLMDVNHGTISLVKHCSLAFRRSILGGGPISIAQLRFAVRRRTYLIEFIAVPTPLLIAGRFYVNGNGNCELR